MMNPKTEIWIITTILKEARLEDKGISEDVKERKKSI